MAIQASKEKVLSQPCVEGAGSQPVVALQADEWNSGGLL